MKLRVIIILKKWIDEQYGFAYAENYSDEIVEFAESNINDIVNGFAWDWWETEELEEGEDIELVARFYPADCEDIDEKAIAITSVWQSELAKE